jgi:hypothetical protein
MQDDRLTPSERELEAALGGLKPARAGTNRDRFMFQAGRASGRRQNRLWQAVSCCLGIVLAASLVYRQAPPTVATPAPIVATHVQDPPPTEIAGRYYDLPATRYSGPISEYLRMRAAVLRRGIDALPASHPAPAAEDEEPLTREHPDRIVSST